MYGGKYLMLTYAQIKDDFDWNKIKLIAENAQAQMHIAKELHQDGNPHIHAFLAFTGRRFQTRTLKHFDIDGHHPNWVWVKTTEWLMWDYVNKDGNILYSNLNRPQVTEVTKMPRALPQWETVLSSKTPDEFMAQMRQHFPQQLLTAYGNICNYVSDTYNAQEIPEYVSPNVLVDWEVAPKDLRLWIDGYTTGLAMGIDEKFTPKERLALHCFLTLNT